MLTCVPQGICSWKFIIPEAGNAEVELFTMARRGAIRFQGVEYAVAGSGILSICWTLTRGQECVATATRGANPFSGTFDLKSAQGTWQLIQKGFLGNSLEIRLNEQPIGLIEAVHFFTRRATIECSNAMPALQQLFAFWLVAEKWRVQAD